MRIGLYGLPGAGKTCVLKKITSLKALCGSALLMKMEPNFPELSEKEKAKIRRKLATRLKEQDNFIMDGHYSFGDTIVFTEEDGALYDILLYLYVKPELLAQRMTHSEKNRKYLIYDIAGWQSREIEALRDYCHRNNKDFYVIDNPEEGFFRNINPILEFTDCILNGYSCVAFAEEAVGQILCRFSDSREISLLDGDRTLSKEDSSARLGYRTNIFDGNFYSGFQAWRHHREFTRYLNETAHQNQNIVELPLNKTVLNKIVGFGVILTTGYETAWQQVAQKTTLQLYSGIQMCSDTKYFITKFLQESGKIVTAFGDSMNDYYMLRQADTAYLVLKQNGTVSSSLRNRNLEGMIFV